MTTTTTNRAYRKPTGTDAPNLPILVGNLADDVDADVTNLFRETTTDWNTCTGTGAWYGNGAVNGPRGTTGQYQGFSFASLSGTPATTLIVWRISSTSTNVEEWTRIWDGTAWGAWCQTGGNPVYTGTVTAASGYTSTMTVAKVNGMVIPKGGITKNSGNFPNGASGTTIGTLPAGFEPAVGFTLPIFGYNTNVTLGLLAIQVAAGDTTLTLWNPNGIAAGGAYFTGLSWPNV